MFDLGIQELVVIFVVALIVFGPKRLPELGRTLGKGILELKKAMEGVREQIRVESEGTQEQVTSSTADENKEEAPAQGTDTAEGSHDSGETKHEPTGSGGAADTKDFYRADEKPSQERKEDPVDGR